MQAHPTVSEGQSLPSLPQEDWKALHYAAVISDGKNIALLGIGDTVTECRDNVLKNMISAKVAPAKIQSLSKSLAFINHNETVLIPLKNKIQKLGIYYCESKVFIYAQRYGVYGMKLNYDLYTESPLLRFAGYDEGHRTAAQFKFNF